MLLPLCYILADVIANYLMADVIAIMFYIGWCYCQLCYVGYSTTFHILFVVDGITTLYMADVVAMVADGNCHMCMGWCYYPIYDRWNSQLWQLMNSLWQMVWPLMWLADVIAMVADGIGHCWNVIYNYYTQ